VAAATALKAQELGLARVILKREEYIKAATQRILDSQKMMRALMDEHNIAPMPIA